MKNLFQYAAVACLLALQAGCSDKTPDRLPVTGRVLIDGKPLTHGRIEVAPQGARPAYGEIDGEGRFTLTTFKKGDGTVVGVHPIAVSAVEHVDGFHDKWHAPKKYSSLGSGLTIEVDPNVSEPTVELSWDGGKPFVERNDVD